MAGEPKNKQTNKEECSWFYTTTLSACDVGQSIDFCVWLLLLLLLLLFSSTVGGADPEQPAAAVGRQDVRAELPNGRLAALGRRHLVEGRRPPAALPRNGTVFSLSLSLSLSLNLCLSPVVHPKR